jgi:hypothetical protein
VYITLALNVLNIQIVMVQNSRPKLHQTSLLQYPRTDQVTAAFLPQFLATNCPALLRGRVGQQPREKLWTSGEVIQLFSRSWPTSCLEDLLALGVWVRCVDSIKAGRGSREFGAIIMLPTTVEIKDSDYPGSPARAARTCPKCDHLCSGKMMGGNPNHWATTVSLV